MKIYVPEEINLFLKSVALDNKDYHVYLAGGFYEKM